MPLKSSLKISCKNYRKQKTKHNILTMFYYEKNAVSLSSPNQFYHIIKLTCELTIPQSFGLNYHQDKKKNEPEA